MNYTTLPAFGPDQTVNIVIESPRGSTVKLKYDATLEAFTLSRPLTEGLIYPFDWGFVPSTHAADGDPVDAMVVWDRSSFPGVVLACRLIGVLAVEQNSKRRAGERERNDRLVALPLEAPRYASIKDVDDLPARLREEIEAFFLASTAFEKKDLTSLKQGDTAFS
jgi:inorganic pyrophosphatase